MRSSRERPLFTRRGVALIAVAAILAILTATTMQFRYQTNIDYASAANARDSMRALFLARSVMNMSRLLIRVQKILDGKRRALAQMGLPDVQIADFVSMLEVPICGHKDEVGDMVSVAGLDTSSVKGLGIDYGQCHIETFASEDGKINLNCANGGEPTRLAIGKQLIALTSSTAFDKIFEERDGDGQFTDRETFVKALIDYVDRDDAQFGTSGGAEDYGYESLKEAYRAKNNYLDSIDELQLVRGMDDRKWDIFGQLLTIYGGCKVNVSAVTNPLQMIMLFVQAAANPQDPVLLNPIKLILLAQRAAQARALGMPFDTLQTFQQFVKDPDGGLSALAAAAGGSSGTPAAGGTNALGLPTVDGLTLDNKKLQDVAWAGSRRTYRIVAAAQVGRVEKRIIAVWDNDNVNQNVTDPLYAKGAWVYWREE
jgi:type II secretory pathway component PulK